LVRDRFKVWVQDGALGVEGGAVPVGGAGRVEAAGQLVLGAGREVGLGLEDEDLVGEEGGPDGFEVVL
jgi:hypothetical protein